MTGSNTGNPNNKVINNDRAAWLQGPPAICTRVPDEQPKPFRLVLLGAPGVGKGTQAELLSERLGACHLSTGDVFRAAGKCTDGKLSLAMKAAQDYMRRGELVPDATVWEMIRERSHCLIDCHGFILDGFPRTITQAESLRKLLDSSKIGLSAVLNYELPVEEIVQRLSGRRTCEKCKAVYHIKERPPKIESMCDRCGGARIQREDDRPESISVRLDAYDRSTAPLFRYYQSQGLLVPVIAKGTPGQILERSLENLANLPKPVLVP